MSAGAFRHVIDALRFELDDPRREPHRQVMRALGDEHSQLACKFVTRRAYDAEFGAVLDHEVTG